MYGCIRDLAGGCTTEIVGSSFPGIFKNFILFTIRGCGGGGQAVCGLIYELCM